MDFNSKHFPLWKRLLDLLGVFIIVTLLLPLIIFMIVYIKIVSPGPVLYKQKRVGYLGKTFNMWKFRSMEIGVSCTEHQTYMTELIQSGNKVMTKKDHTYSLIPGGNIIRSLCLDEIPQLINVARKEMSLVGPRPALPYEVRQYSTWHSKRFEAIPGMTGLWQVSGKNKLSFIEMIDLDIKYIQNISLKQDVAILAKTVPTVFKLVLDKG